MPPPIIFWMCTYIIIVNKLGNAFPKKGSNIMNEHDGIDNFYESEEWMNAEHDFNETTVDGLLRASRREKVELSVIIDDIRHKSKDINMKMCGIKISVANADAETLPTLLEEMCTLAVERFKLDMCAEALERHAKCVDEIDDVLHEMKDIEKREGTIKGGVVGAAMKAVEIMKERHDRGEEKSEIDNGGK